MVQILLMLKVLFTQDSDVQDPFFCASPSSQPSLFCITCPFYFFLCTTIHRYPIFSTNVMCKIYTGYYGTSEIEHGLCACTVFTTFMQIGICLPMFEWSVPQKLSSFRYSIRVSETKQTGPYTILRAFQQMTIPHFHCMNYNLGLFKFWAGISQVLFSHPNRTLFTRNQFSGVWLKQIVFWVCQNTNIYFSFSLHRKGAVSASKGVFFEKCKKKHGRWRSDVVDWFIWLWNIFGSLTS